MAIHKPALSVQEARRLSSVRVEAPAAAEVTLRRDAAQPTATQSAPSEPHPDLRVAATAVAVRSVPDRPVSPPETVMSANMTDHPRLQPPSVAVGTRIQVFVSAAFPVRGYSRSFDVLSAKYPPAKALQMILRRAMDEYEDRLADGSFAGFPETYPEVAHIVTQTSRIMPQELVDLARLHFDPLGFESSRAFGLKLATAALAAFFSNERKRN